MTANDLKQHIFVQAERNHPLIVRIRRLIHQHPELGFEEQQTSELVMQTLTTIGIPARRVAGMGVVGMIRGRKARPVVALRGDMDALPITEKSKTAYRSRVSGTMHACGHDAHTSMVLGAAMILQSIRNRLEGSVKLIFEPSEERLPAGARELIRKGVLTNPKVDAIFGLHVFARAEAGTVGFRPGPMMAAADEVEIIIRGRGGHGALPHLTVDPIVVGAEVVTGLQKVVSRGVNPFSPHVLTIGRIEGGKAHNVIPDEVHICGTLRSLDERWRTRALKSIARIVKGITAASGARFEIHVREAAPVLVNDPKTTRFAEEACRAYLGADKVFAVEPVLGSETFAYYLQRVPGTFFRLGIANKRRGIVHDLHTPAFDIDESAMRVGSGFFAYLVYEYLRTMPRSAEGAAFRATT